MHEQADLQTFHITTHNNYLFFLLFSLTETKETFCFHYPLFNLKISDWLSLVPEPDNIH